MREISVSVRRIVEFILRSGSIDSGYMSQNRMQDGIRVHQRVQRARKKEIAAEGLEYEPEVRLRLTLEHMDIRWNVSGIADGIVKDGDTVVIEEIKSSTRDLESITFDESHWHMAQAKCYGYMYAELYGMNAIRIDLTYCSVEGNNVRTFSHDFTPGELKAFFYDLLERYSRWAVLSFDKHKKLVETAKSLSFPYNNYRRGQREFAILAYRAVQNRSKLYIEAPTGTGKTISALFPAVKALGEGLADKVFYLTAKTITRQAAEQAAGMLIDKGCKLTYVAMTAKDKLCILPERACSPITCPHADGHFDRVNDALWALLERTDRITRTYIDEVAREFTVCPYELMLDASLFAHVIICDYNYVFDPTVYLKRFFNDSITEKYTFLIDESHNLVERAREMYSATLLTSDFTKIRKAFKKRVKINKMGLALANIIAELKHITEAIPEGRDASVTYSPPFELARLLKLFKEPMDEWLAANVGDEHFDDCMDTYFKMLDFIRVYDWLDDRYAIYAERLRTDGELTLLCLDPSKNIADTLKKAVGSVFFSATLTPLGYFRDVLGGVKEDKTARLPSPFNRDNLCVTIENRVSTKYIHRNQKSYEAAADALYTMVSGRTGNYFAFFSSYAYLDNVLDEFIVKYPGVRVHPQGREMNEAERESFLAEFKENPKESMLAFAVMGGVFSEGIDLTGDRLIGAAVVGVGLPMVSLKRDALRDYYEKTLSGGFEYAYMYPGMSKVLQAAGRVLRTETDRGVIMLIDTRFTDRRYAELFPYEWQNYQTAWDKDLKDVYQDFWDKNKED